MVTRKPGRAPKVRSAAQSDKERKATAMAAALNDCLRRSERGEVPTVPHAVFTFADGSTVHIPIDLLKRNRSRQHGFIDGSKGGRPVTKARPDKAAIFLEFSQYRLDCELGYHEARRKFTLKMVRRFVDVDKRTVYRWIADALDSPK